MKVNLGKVDDSVYVKDISFPKSEIPKHKGATVIITSLQPEDADNFNKGDYVYCEEVDENYCFEVIFKYVVKKVSDIDQLTKPQSDAIKRLGGTTVLTLQKTKYERPYKLSTIKAKYPEKVYLKLKQDKVHSWRARTGIEVIHLEPTKEEQERVWKNWHFMSTKMKAVSDAKCIELFGVDNKRHYEICKDEKNISDDPVFQSIIRKYNQMFGFDLSKFKLISTKTPRYTNGHPADMPLNQFGGCYTSLGIVYINSNLQPVMKYYGVKVSETELKKTLIAHELGHAVYREFAGNKFIEKILDAAKEAKFTSEYLEHVKPEKLKEETFCEFIAAVINGKQKFKE